MVTRIYATNVEVLTTDVFTDNRVPGTPTVSLAPTTRGYILTPDPVRRPKPADLFANATPSFAQSKHIKFAPCHRTEKVDDHYSRFTAGPASHWADHVETTVPTVFGLDDFGRLDLKMRLRIKDQKVDLLTSIAESRQAANLVTDLATDMIEAFKKLKRGHPAAAVRRMLSDPRTRADRAIANRWLSYSFGLKPLMSDIYGLADASLMLLHEGFPQYQLVSERTTTEDHVSLGLVRGMTTARTLKRVRARYMIQSEERKLLSQLGITNPASFMWEMTPWSFAVDWVLDIGKFLQGLDALVGISQLKVQRSAGVDVWYQQNVDGVVCAAPWAIVGYSKIRQRLGVSDELGIGSPQFKSFFKTGDLQGRLANAGALLRQTTGR